MRGVVITVRSACGVCWIGRFGLRGQVHRITWLIGGTFFLRLFASEQALGMALSAAGLDTCPASVVGILGIGVAASISPTMGGILFRVFGPASVWLKAALPLLLVPPIAAPLTAELPTSVVGAVGVAAAGLVVTMILVGRLASAGASVVRGSGTAETSLLLSPAMQRHTAAAAATLRSPRVATAAVVIGGTTSAVLWGCTRPERRDCWTVAPGLVGLTTGLYVSSSFSRDTRALSRYLVLPSEIF
jgi:hypothetical protein